MPTRAEDRVELLVAGHTHDDWESYEIDSDLLVPADAWRVTLGSATGSLPEDVTEGAEATLRVGGDVVMTGRIDQIDDVVARGRHAWTIAGRDRAAVLVDCSAPVFSQRQATLDDVIAKVCRPLGITRHEIRADEPRKTRLREKISVEPGDTAWQVLANAAEANGLWPWFEPDGTLVIGGPDYTAEPVATLQMARYPGVGNNVEALSVRRNIARRHSHLTVLGQCHGTALEPARNAIRGEARDIGVAWYRPRIVVDHEADSVAIAEDRARKLLADSRLDGFAIEADVAGNRIAQRGAAGDGRLWQPGQRVRVISEPHRIDGIYFLMARRFVGGRGGFRTHLTLREDGAWVLDAHPHKRKHRRGKNHVAGQIIDLSQAAQ